jgi:hypothetical protein
LLLLASFARAAASPSAGTPTAQAGGISAAAFVAGAQASLCAELARLDGGDLTQALSQAAGTHGQLRIILDLSEQTTRLQGRALSLAFQASSPTVQAALELRWTSGAGRPQRRILADETRLLLWTQGQAPLRDDQGAAAFRQGFESRWARALTVLPEAQALEDDLKALPDPRDKDPHIARRKNAAGPSAGSGQAQDNEGTP